MLARATLLCFTDIEKWFDPCFVKRCLVIALPQGNMKCICVNATDHAWSKLVP